MQEKIRYLCEHIVLSTPDGHWVIDTGSPQSFSTSGILVLAGERFPCPVNFSDQFDARVLSGMIGFSVEGLIGQDILRNFDIVWDLKAGRGVFSREKLLISGKTVKASDFMGVPVVEVSINGQQQLFFFDTAAPVSFWQGEDLSQFEAGPVVKDFYPGVGSFDVQVYQVPFQLAGESMTLRCGRLPEVLGMTLSMANANGILGNQFMQNRVVRYSARQNLLGLE